MEKILPIYPVKYSKVRRYLKNQRCILVSKNATVEKWTNGKTSVQFKIQHPLAKGTVKMEFDTLNMSIEDFESFVLKIRY